MQVGSNIRRWGRRTNEPFSLVAIGRLGRILGPKTWTRRATIALGSKLIRGFYTTTTKEQWGFLRWSLPPYSSDFITSPSCTPNWKQSHACHNFHDGGDEEEVAVEAISCSYAAERVARGFFCFTPLRSPRRGLLSKRGREEEKRHFRGHLYYANEPLFRSAAAKRTDFIESSKEKKTSFL